MQAKQIEQLIEAGQPQFGVFSQVKRLNYLDYRSHLLSQKPVAKWRKQLKANQFAFIQLLQPPYRICLALATIKLATTAFAYIYNEESGQFEVVEALQPLLRHSHFSGDHQQGEMRFEHADLSLQMQFSQQSIQLILDSQLFAVNASCQRSRQPLAVCSPSGRRGWSFTQKEPLQITEGELTFKADSKHFESVASSASISADKPLPVNRSRIKFDSQARANLDWTLGFMRHETNWFWSCINSQLSDGRQFMLNLSMGVNETGVNENACWIDGQIYYLPPVLFKRPPIDKNYRSMIKSVTKKVVRRQAVKQNEAQQQAAYNHNNSHNSSDRDLQHLTDWHISNQDLGWSKVRVDFRFTPLKVYKKTDNYGVVASVFEQWIGLYSGKVYIQTQTGEEAVQLDRVMGLAEDHFAKW
ncbi:DUF2804 family protein [Psychrobacter sp. FDAARGOS_221]|uniref:DUF2804 family protein n=1 Tax=Psychrobacter sp. FDAARGOS_221 TaxID=1975705 RepID=UPI001D0D419B|nr:DUF2804 family protein [Psychrobacter sp. FDAARGOS_221]